MSDVFWIWAAVIMGILIFLASCGPLFHLYGEYKKDDK